MADASCRYYQIEVANMIGSRDIEYQVYNEQGYDREGFDRSGLNAYGYNRLDMDVTHQYKKTEVFWDGIGCGGHSITYSPRTKYPVKKRLFKHKTRLKIRKLLVILACCFFLVLFLIIFCLVQN